MTRNIQKIVQNDAKWPKIFRIHNIVEMVTNAWKWTRNAKKQDRNVTPEMQRYGSDMKVTKK